MPDAANRGVRRQIDASQTHPQPLPSQESAAWDRAVARAVGSIVRQLVENRGSFGFLRSGHSGSEGRPHAPRDPERGRSAHADASNVPAPTLLASGRTGGGVDHCVGLLRSSAPFAKVIFSSAPHRFPSLARKTSTVTVWPIAFSKSLFPRLLRVNQLSDAA